MRTLIGPVVVNPADALAGDIDLLRSHLSSLVDSSTRSAVLLFVEGLESGGVVVSKLGDLLTPQEAAEMMGVSRQYVDKLIQAGRIHAELKPASTHRVIRTSDVIAFTRKREEGNARVGSTINELIDAGLEY